MNKMGFVSILGAIFVGVFFATASLAEAGTINTGISKVDKTKAAAGAVCYITDTAGNIVFDVSLSSYFSADHQMYYLWYFPNQPSFNQKFVLKFDSDGFGLSKQIQKMNYPLNSGSVLALAFSMTPENTSLGLAKFKVKTDTEACTYIFNVVP